MFYSQIFLARKGPLGTVWCAAHLQHKLKKSHYISTDIPSTVERIMFPALPIALRLSSHLLLGVVRIYSKKVDYLHHDCNSLWVSLRHTFRPVDVNLVETATHAQFSAVTLPETYQLDAMDIDLAYDMSQDNHLKSQDEITLTDQYSPGRELYVRITIDNDITPEVSRSQASPHGEFDSMQIDSIPQEPVTAHLQDRDGDGAMSSERFEEGSSLPDIPDVVEQLRDNPGDYIQDISMEDVPIASQPNSPSSKNTFEKDVETPLQEHILSARRESPQSSVCREPSPALNDVLSGGFDSLAFGAHEEFALQPSPPPEIPQRRQRKRKQYFDKDIVLTNQFVKKGLDDTSDIVRKRAKLPSSSLQTWRLGNKRKKENILFESLTSGLCAELQSIPSKDLTSVKINSVPLEVTQPEERPAESPVRTPSGDIVIERLRDAEQHDEVHNSLIHDNMPSPRQVTPQKSPENDQTIPSVLHTVSEATFGSEQEPRFGNLSDQGMFTGSGQLDMDDLEFRIDGSNVGLSDTHEFRDSTDLDVLSFLEQDNNGSTDSQGARERDTMSVRTRAVAQFLKNHSPLSYNSGSAPEELSLNQILERRSRKLCARMFYETLVLKNYEVIDVKQDEAYGDITLKLNATLSNVKI